MADTLIKSYLYSEVFCSACRTFVLFEPLDLTLGCGHELESGNDIRDVFMYKGKS